MERNILYIDPDHNEDIVKLLNKEGFHTELRSAACLLSNVHNIDLILLSDKFQNIVSVLLEREQQYAYYDHYGRI